MKVIFREHFADLKPVRRAKSGLTIENSKNRRWAQFSSSGITNLISRKFLLTTQNPQARSFKSSREITLGFTLKKKRARKNNRSLDYSSSCRSFSKTEKSSSVVVSPATVPPEASSLSRRRIIFPLRVFGRASVKRRSSGLASEPISLAT